MKVYIGQRDMKALLEYASLFAVTRKHSYVPIFRHVLIRATRGGFPRLIVAATDGTEFCAAWFLTDVAEEGEVLVEAKALLEFVKSLPDETILLETHTDTDGEHTKTTLTVRCGDIESTFPVLDAEFPQLQRIRGPKVEVRGDQFATALRRVLPATEKDQARPALTGILFQVEDATLHLVATDGYRLAHAHVDAHVPEGLEIPERRWVVPASALAKVEKILRKQKYDGPVILQPDFPDDPDDKKETPRTAIRWAGVSVGTYNIDATFPQWEKIVEPCRANPLRIIADEREITRAVKALKTAAQGSNDTVRIRVNGVVEMSARSAEVGERRLTLATAEIYGQQGEDYEIGFNWKYLQDALNALKKQRVLLAFSDVPSRAAWIGPAEYFADFEYVLMPMRISK